MCLLYRGFRTVSIALLCCYHRQLSIAHMSVVFVQYHVSFVTWCASCTQQSRWVRVDVSQQTWLNAVLSHLALTSPDLLVVRYKLFWRCKGTFETELAVRVTTGIRLGSWLASFKHERFGDWRCSRLTHDRWNVLHACVQFTDRNPRRLPFLLAERRWLTRRVSAMDGLLTWLDRPLYQLEMANFRFNCGSFTRTLISETRQW